MSTKSTAIGLLAGLAAAAPIFPGPATAQELGLRAGWQPYVGCWEPVTAEEDQGILCLVPEARDVEMLTMVDGEIMFREPLVADGGTHEFERDDCRGTESARFSEDRRRLYTASLVTCDGQAFRRSTGIISMPTPDEWIDVRAMDANGTSAVWSKRYRRTSRREPSRPGPDIPPARPSPFAVRGGVAFPASAITIDDVIDASRNVGVDAVAGWLAEVGRPFEGLSVEDLIRLADAGVATAVIDMVVELSFQEHFAVKEEADRSRGRRWYGRRNPHHHDHGRPGIAVTVIREDRREDRPVRPPDRPRVTRVINVKTDPPAKGGRPGQAVAGKGYRKPESTASSGCRNGDKSCKGTAGRKAVRRGGR
ncbi:MAG: hypothetical protein OXK74_11490 [Gemmatimonadota bacterium]|nr:hypothetical protein [Gemmatimonadota bacterium]